jgi:hypothetical protein
MSEGFLRKKVASIRPSRGVILWLKGLELKVAIPVQVAKFSIVLAVGNINYRVISKQSLFEFTGSLAWPYSRS